MDVVVIDVQDIRPGDYVISVDYEQDGSPCCLRVSRVVSEDASGS